MTTFVKNMPKIERLVIMFTMLAMVGVVGVHMTIVVLRLITEFPIAAWPITIATIVTTSIVTVCVPYCARLLPAWLDGSAKAHPIRASLFAIFALVAVTQTARITTHMVTRDAGMCILTTNEFWTKHECGPAYFHAVELHERGESNIYHADHYPVLNRNVEPHTEIEGMEVEDAFQYPPQFLLLPKLLLLLTNHFPTIRVTWFSLQFIGIAASLLFLAHWVGGHTGRWMAMLAPVVLLSPAALFSFQYTQFHFAAIALAITGMTAFEKNRCALGGALLAAATVGKIFPGFLILLLLAEKRWKEIGWTGVFGLAYTVAALVVFGLDPFIAFIAYHVPRLQSFAAFDFLNTWPELRFELIAANISPYGQIMRLAEMGIPGMSTGLASRCNSLYTLLLVALIVVTSRHLVSKARRTQTWLAVIGLASMASPAAWGDYVPVTALWLLTALAADAVSHRKLAIALAVSGAFFYFLVGLVPLGSFPAPKVTFSLATVSFVLLVGIKVWVILRKPEHALA